MTKHPFVAGQSWNADSSLITFLRAEKERSSKQFAMGLQRNIHSAVPTLGNADVSCLNDSSIHKVVGLGSDTVAQTERYSDAAADTRF